MKKKEPTCKELNSFIKDETQGTKTYGKIKGFSRLSKEEAGHKIFIQKKKKQMKCNV